jgi:hypothetical protein
MKNRFIVAALLLVVTSPVLAQAPKRPMAKVPVIELFGGFSYARFSAGGPTMNGYGGLGSFAWNFKPWVQVVADASYNRAHATGSSTNLYGNHYGFRFFHRSSQKWGPTPFAEALFGGSQAATRVGGSGGPLFSNTGFSMKGGGGLDLGVSSRITIRVTDAAYYRTSFFSAHQNNIWLSSGIVFRLGGVR